MATLDDLFNEIRPQVPEAGVLTIRRAIRTALKVFCQQSQAWVYTVESFPLVADVHAQDLSASLPEGAGIFMINADPTYVSDGGIIKRSSPQELTRLIANWRNMPAAIPRYCFVESPTTVSFVATPQEALEVDIPLTLMPLQNTTVLDSDLLENYWDVFTTGALGILFAMQKTPWENAGLASVNSAAFGESVENAKIHSSHNKSPQVTNMSFSW
jgi:hypothetical protein